jgi:CHAT domain-containing protein
MDAIAYQDTGTLIILPDGPLHSLPFAAFKDNQGRFLVERFPLSYAPSFSVLQHCLDMKRGRLSNRPSILLLDGSSDLPGADAELSQLMRLFGSRASLLSNRDLKSLSLVASTSEIIHFAGHARFRNNRPYLALSSANGELSLDTGSVQELKLKSNRLVTLAGCSTGVGPGGEGETPWGFLPAFFSAGAPALLVSLLPLDDLATNELCQKLYPLLTSQSISKAAALQQVQISMLRSVNSRTAASALSWAPLVLVGDPR